MSRYLNAALNVIEYPQTITQKDKNIIINLLYTPSQDQDTLAKQCKLAGKAINRNY